MDFEVRDHMRLGAELGVVDFEAGAAVSGTKFVYLRGACALLEVALVSWALQRVTAAGFMPHSTPDLVRGAVLEKCGFQPRGANTQVSRTSSFKITDISKQEAKPTDGCSLCPFSHL